MKTNFWSIENPEEKARAKQKKLEYSIMLKQQIEEKKRQKEIEKKKAIEEEIKYQARYNNSFSNNYHDNRSFLAQNYPEQQAKTMELQINNNLPQLALQESNMNNTPEPKSTEAITLGYVEELFRMFVEEQIKVINDYERELDLFFAQKQFGYLTKNHKTKAIEQIQFEKNKLKTKLGFFPLENNYNHKIEELFDKILTKKVNKIKNDREHFYRKNAISKIDDIPKEIDYVSKYTDDNNNVTFNHYSKDVNHNIVDSNENYLTPDFNDLPIEVQQSLVGFSKLVEIHKNDNNNNEDDNFLVTWRDNLIKQKSSRINSRQKTIQFKEEDKAYDKNDKESIDYGHLQTENSLKANNRKKLSPILFDNYNQRRNEATEKEGVSMKHQTISYNNYPNAVIQKYDHAYSKSNVFDFNQRETAKNRTMINSQGKGSFQDIFNKNKSKIKSNTKLSHKELELKEVVQKDKSSTKEVRPLILNNQKDKETIDVTSDKDINNNNINENDNINEEHQEEIEEDIQDNDNTKEDINDKLIIDKIATEKYENTIKEKKKEKEIERTSESQSSTSKKKLKTRYYLSPINNHESNIKINPFHNTKEIEKLNAIVNNEMDISESDELRDTFHHKRKHSYHCLPPQIVPLRNVASDSNRKAKKLYHSRDKYNNFSVSKPVSANKRNLIPKFNYKESQLPSENDSILNELDKFRELALNDIGSADLGNNPLSPSRNKTKSIDLIPKDIIKKYSNVISSGASNDNYY